MFNHHHHNEAEQAGPRRVSPLDASWLYVESQSTPMHVGCLQIFSKPRGAHRDYTARLHEEMLLSTHVAEPYSLKLGDSLLHMVLPTWVHEPHPDLDYHLRRVALPHPAGEAELANLLTRLHSRPLDMSRPLWELYLIDGLEHRRFAIFTKIHHSLVDGISGMHLLQAALSTSPQQRHMAAPWSCGRRPHHAESAAHGEEHLHGGLNHALELGMAQLRSGPRVVTALTTLAKAALSGSHSPLAAPYTAPLSVFNGEASSLRHFARLQLPLKRLQDLARHAGVKLNDVLFAICGGALRRYLTEQQTLPERPLVAGIPVSVRPKGDTAVGTAITFALAALGTDLEQPRERLRRIHEATTAAKEHLQRMDRTALTDYTLLVMAPYILELIAGRGRSAHPVFNLVISNVPGPAEPLYFNGARMEEMYPLSVLTHGQALNITAISYDGRLNIGFIGCKEAVPEIEKLAAYTGEALDELEQACGARHRAHHGAAQAA